jgi:hypothetical protein
MLCLSFKSCPLWAYFCIKQRVLILMSKYYRRIIRSSCRPPGANAINFFTRSTRFGKITNRVWWILHAYISMAHVGKSVCLQNIRTTKPGPTAYLPYITTKYWTRLKYWTWTNPLAYLQRVWVMGNCEI